MFSTVNVQHLESLNDQVAELTGVRVRETFPDPVLAAADEVVLVDITPEALLERLRAGKVYQADACRRAQRLLPIENLEALREIALRQVAEEVEAKRLVRDDRAGARDERLLDRAAPQAVGERLLALVTPEPELAAAWCAGRGARPSGSAPSSTCCGCAARRAGREEREQLTRCAGWPRVLGAHLLVEEGDDVAEVAARVAARARHHLRPARRARAARAACGRLREPLPSGSCERLPGVDVRIVADRSHASEEPR